MTDQLSSQRAARTSIWPALIKWLGSATGDRNLDQPGRPSSLCDVCETIDLQVNDFVVVDSGHDLATAIPRVDLGLVREIREKSFCPLCRLVACIADRPVDQRTPSKHSHQDVRCYFTWVVDGQEQSYNDKGEPEGTLKPCTRRILVYSEPQAFKDGYLILLGEDAPSPVFLGRQVSSANLDVPLLRGWLSICESQHGYACSTPFGSLSMPVKQNYPFRVIDVQHMCITEKNYDCRYLALSYLWGKPTGLFKSTSALLDPSDDESLYTVGRLAKIHLSRTIRDAIVLTEELGEKYLWVDSLCLAHDNSFQYHDVDRVYLRATLTIVAGTGNDANAGLPGVKSGSRAFRQEIETIKPGFRLMVSHLAEDYISTSQWDSRAWTFQERILSRRCLLFINGRIYFQCRRITFCEDIFSPTSFGWSLDCIDMPTRIFQQRPFAQFTSAIELYTRRHLTFESDILNAFEGVGRVLQQRMNSPLLSGVPEKVLDSSLLWESLQPLRRRAGFPSWSWVGWVGEIQWTLPGLPDSVQSWIEWRTSDKRLIYQEQDRTYQHIPPSSIGPLKLPKGVSPGASQLLRFKSISVFLKISEPSTAVSSEPPPLRRRQSSSTALPTTRPTTLSPSLIRAGITDHNGMWCGTILLEKAWSLRIGDVVEFVVLSICPNFTDSEVRAWPEHLSETKTSDGQVFNVILIKREVSIVERIGLGRVKQSAIEESFPPGPGWDEFLLG